MIGQHMDREHAKGKERLLKAAQKLSQERPFDDITIDDIIKEAELSRPAFYYHFTGGKEELRAELVKRGLLAAAPAQDIRQVILETAVRLFARSGLSATTLDDIAAEAGVTRGTLSWHFHCKDDLLAAIIKHYGPHSMLRPVLDQLDRDLQNGVAIDNEELMRRIAGAFYDGFSSQSDLTRLAVLVIYTHPQAAHIITEKIAKGRKKIVEYIEQRQQEGYLRRDLDPRLLIQVIAATFAMRAVGRDLNNLLPLCDMSREEFIDQLVSLLLYGFVERDHRP